MAEKQENDTNIKTLFSSIDKNNFGFITKSSLEEYLNTEYKLPKKIASSQALQLINLMSKNINNNVEINYNDFSKFINKQEKELLSLYNELISSNKIINNATPIKNGITLNNLNEAFQNSEIQNIKQTHLKGLIKTIGNKKEYITYNDLKDYFILSPQINNIRNVYNYYNTRNHKKTYKKDPKYLLASAISGCVSRTMTAPLDRLRVLFQTHSRLGVKLTVKDGVKLIYENGGITSFWRGNGLNVLKIAPQTMLKFYLYEAYKPALNLKQTLKEGKKEGELDPRLKVLKDISIGAAGGLLSQVFIFPIETLKTRVMSETQRGKFAPPNSVASSSSSSVSKSVVNSTTKATAKSTIQGKQNNLVLRIAKDMWKEGGIRPFFRGLTPAVASALPYYLTDFTLYEQSKKLYLNIVNRNRIKGDRITKINPIYLLGAGMVSNACAVSMVYPFALVRTRLQAQGTVGHPMRYKNSLDVIRKTYARESIRGFYHGIVPTLVKNVPSASISYVIYELCKKYMDLE
ncbi:mitochondrial carrier [Piromyces finnis]|uniref:Mitochondrial carrier n=1 Tax=Piromyces finnis TaxID=1754191 RepID=A0A1Y1V006_9FUNG|nr:mitochondrial carrier [Piromyces finnis]|eukprot:ORX43737.1 mitochondrial carrier [Piromyces finnis]